MKKFECRVTRSCIYWADDKRENIDFTIEAKSLNEAKNQLYAKAIRLEMTSAAKLVQLILIKVEGKWIEVKGQTVDSVGQL